MDERMTPPEPLTIGSLLRQAHARMGLSLRNLEAITHISRPMLHCLERDQIDQPKPHVLHQLAEPRSLPAGLRAIDPTHAASRRGCHATDVRAAWRINA